MYASFGNFIPFYLSPFLSPISPMTKAISRRAYLPSFRVRFKIDARTGCSCPPSSRDSIRRPARKLLAAVLVGLAKESTESSRSSSLGHFPSAPILVSRYLSESTKVREHRKIDAQRGRPNIRRERGGKKKTSSVTAARKSSRKFPEGASRSERLARPSRTRKTGALCIEGP